MVREHAGPRRRVVDEHMFAVDFGFPNPSTFRLQLFTGTGLRPVAVVTQARDEGRSLSNGAERYVEAVWSRCCPTEPQPPIWITRELQLLDDSSDEDSGGRPQERSTGGGRWKVCQGFRVIGFEVTGPHSVASPPKWGPGLTDEEVTRLVGGAAVDLDRGSGWIPRAPEQDVTSRFTTMLAVRLPRPDLADDDLPCMRTPAGPVDRLGWQLHPRSPRTCCWYHRGDWRPAAYSARTILDSARRARIAPEDVAVFGLGEAASLDLDRWQRQAVRSLFSEPIQPSTEIGYIGGRHRALAAVHAGVHIVPVQLWDTPSLAARLGDRLRGHRGA